LLDEEDADLPFDLEFRVQGEDNQTQSIKAHKWPLAASSAVFRKQFFGTMAQTAERPVEDDREIVEIKDFTFSIMDRMVKMVYTGSLDTIKECKDVQEIFEMYKLFDKYELKRLMAETKKKITSFSISTENVFDCLKVADLYRNLENFEVICKQFLRRCAICLHFEIREDYTVLCKIWAENQYDPVLLDLLFREINALRECNDTCSNCKEVIYICKRGQPVIERSGRYHSNTLPVGLRITVHGKPQVALDDGYYHVTKRVDTVDAGVKYDCA